MSAMSLQQEWEHNNQARMDVLLRERLDTLMRRTDRLFAGLLVFQWTAGIVLACAISPQVWAGVASQTHQHVWLAILMGAGIIAYPLLLIAYRPGAPLTRHAVAIAQMLTSALLIHLTGGRLETHFHIFGSLAFLAFYRDWRVLITASAVTAADHFLRGLFLPLSLYGSQMPGVWRWLEHAGYVVFEDIFLTISIVQGQREMQHIASRQAELEAANASVEAKVEERSREVLASRQEIVWRLAKAGEYRDEETGNHVMRVSRYCQVIAEALGLDRAFVEQLTLSSSLHDIGKIAIPDGILRKPGKLSPEEWDMMKQHCEIGVTILRENYLFPGAEGLNIRQMGNPLLEMAATIALYHHEKWDGSGYPQGLAGEAIPLAARIVALADVYDALSSARPYKPAFPEEEVLRIMAEGVGKHFDPYAYSGLEKSLTALRAIRAEFPDAVMANENVVLKKAA